MWLVGVNVFGGSQCKSARFDQTLRLMCVNGENHEFSAACKRHGECLEGGWGCWCEENLREGLCVEFLASFLGGKEAETPESNIGETQRKGGITQII